jgi:MFS family permease
MIFGFRKELILAALAGTIVVMGLAFITPLFPLYVSQKGATNFQLGLIVSGFTISQFLVQPFFGGLSDRFGRKLFMVGGLACYGVVASLYVLADSLSHVFLIRLLHGIGAGMIWPALSAFILDLAPMERRGETMGFLSGMELIGFAAGPLLGGFLYSVGGMNLPFWGCSVLALLSAVLIWSMVQEKPAGHKAVVTTPFFERYGFSSLRIPDIRLLCLIGFSEAFVWGMIITLLPVMATRLGIPPERIGWLFSAYFIVYIFLQWPMGKWSDRQGRKKPILLGISIYTLAVLLLSREGNLVYLMLVLAIAGAGLGIYSPSVRAGIADLTSEKVRGASLGVFFTTRMLGFFLGPNLGGIIADQWGVGFPFIVGALSLGAGIWASSALSSELSKTVQTAPVQPGWVAGRDRRD